MKPFIIVFGQKYSSYNISIIVGIIFAVYLFYKHEKSISLEEKDDIVSILGLNVVIGFLFANLGDKLLHFQSWEDFREHLFKFTGMTFICGFMGGLLFFVVAYGIMCKDIAKVSVALNAMVPYFVLAQVFGRLGCLLGGCCFGRPTDSVFGIRYPQNSYAFHMYGNQRVYPTPIMEMCLLLIILFCVLSIKSVAEARAVCYVFMYSAGRIMIEFFRGDNRGNIYGGLSPSQRICIVIFWGTLIVKIINLKKIVKSA